MATETLEAALSYLRAGMSVIPCDKATKRPIGHLLPQELDPKSGKMVPGWKGFQKTLPTEDDIRGFFSNGACIGMISGIVSGNLEFIDFDEPEIIRAWRTLLISWNCGALVDRLVAEQSQRKGGWHIGYRHQGKPDGNLKLAQRAPTEGELTADPQAKTKALIETRGEGGYCIVAPSPGYTAKQGAWTDVPLITAEEREALLAAARTFELLPKAHLAPTGTGRVGDDYNDRASIDEIIIPLGWNRSGHDYWTRPGKSNKDGHSATWNHNGSRRFHIFSSSAGIDTGSYDLFGLYTKLHHGGNFGNAAKAAAESGYGDQKAYGKPAGKPRSHNHFDHGATLSDLKLSAVERAGGRRLDTVESKEVPWLIYPYLPLSMISGIEGDPGLGKSYLTAAIATAITLGAKIPLHPKPLPIGNVVMLSGDDSAEYVTKRRLERFGADMSRITIFDTPWDFDQEGLDMLDDILEETKPILLVIDPFNKWTDGALKVPRPTITQNEIMMRIKIMAESRGCAPLISRHIRKSGMGGDNAMHAGYGGIEIVGGYRSALRIDRHPENKLRSVVSHFKSNVSQKGESFSFEIRKVDEQTADFFWTGFEDMTSDEIQVRKVQYGTALEEAKHFLLELLEGKQMVPFAMVEREAEKAGLSMATVKRAKTTLKIDATRKGFSDGQWRWKLPEAEGDPI